MESTPQRLVRQMMKSHRVMSDWNVGARNFARFNQIRRVQWRSLANFWLQVHQLHAKTAARFPRAGNLLGISVLVQEPCLKMLLKCSVCRNISLPHLGQKNLAGAEIPLWIVLCCMFKIPNIVRPIWTVAPLP